MFEQDHVTDDRFTIVVKVNRFFKCLALASLIGSALIPTECNSQPLHALGAGVDSCTAFTAHIAGSPGKSISRIAPNDGQDYYSKSTIYLEWLLGFVTGYNAMVTNPELQIDLDPAGVDLHVRNWCARNPTSNVFTAIRQLAGKNEQH